MEFNCKYIVYLIYLMGVPESTVYSQRLGTVEPVFGHITDAIGIKRFSYRGKRKVDGQWKLMMMCHNTLKIHRYGWIWA
ncbi:MAG: transposase [Candidatus Thiodiazotropha sp.]